MGSDHDDARSRPPHAVPLDAIPVPVVGYDVRAGTVTIAATNDPFDAMSDAVSGETTVRQWLRNYVVAGDSTVEDVCSALAAGNDVDVEIAARSESDAASGQGRYRLRTVDGGAAHEAVDGYCLLTESERGSRDDPDVEVDRIASVISHDLRNPLDVATAHLRAARETGESEHFDHVEQSLDRMERIVRDVLTLARGRRTLDATANVDVGSVASDAWATVDTGAVSMTLGDDLPSIEADPDRLQRLFENLFRNSVEHARPATGDPDDAAAEGQSETRPDRSLRVRVGSTSDGFFVADDGIGIPADERDRVFDPGYSTSEAGSGTGLGLTIVEEIAHAHGWTITLTTGPLDGARFEFHVSSEEA